MTSEDPSQQTTANPPEDASLVPASAPVTAAANPADNATLTPEQNNQSITSPQADGGGSTGEGGDDSGKSYEQEMAEWREQQGKAKAAPVTAPVEPPKGGTTEQPPAATPAATATPAPAAAPVIDEDEVPLIGKDGKMPKMRVRTVTPVDVRAVAEFSASQKAGNTESFVEFIQKRFVSAAPPASDGGNATAAPAATSDTPKPPATVSEVDAQLKTLKNERYQALEEFDFVKARQIEEQEEALRSQRDTISQQEQQSQSAAEQQWAEAEVGYLTQAGKMFPQAVNANDPLVRKANEILQAWYDEGDARAQHPSRALYCYVEAAALLNIAPTAPAVVSAPSLNPTSPPSPVHRPPVSALVAGGDASSNNQRAPVELSYEEEMAQWRAANARRKTAA